MATTELNIASRKQVWDSTFMTEYVRDLRFNPFMGDKNSLMPIIAMYELTGAGKTLNVPLVTRLKGAGVGQNTRLTGNEEALANFNQPLTVHWNRNAVQVQKPEEGWTELDLRAAAKASLKVWASECLRDDLICALNAYTAGSWLRGKGADDATPGKPTPLAAYTAVSEATKDAWLAANTDRYLFGGAVSNHAGNDHSAALLNVDTTNDRLSTAMISLAKQVAAEADRRVRPFKTDNDAGRENWVLFTNSRGFRDLKRDSAMIQANRDARPREVGANPIFQDGDLIWDGVIIREVPEIPTIAGVGNGGSDVAPAFLCGAQAVAVAWGQKPKSRVKAEDDYGFEYGVGIEECRGVTKMAFNGVQNGMVNIFHSAPATAA